MKTLIFNANTADIKLHSLLSGLLRNGPQYPASKAARA